MPSFFFHSFLPKLVSDHLFLAKRCSRPTGYITEQDKQYPYLQGAWVPVGQGRQTRASKHINQINKIISDNDKFMEESNGQGRESNGQVREGRVLEKGEVRGKA